MESGYLDQAEYAGEDCELDDAVSASVYLPFNLARSGLELSVLTP